MFKSPHVPCYLNGFSGHGDDPENKELRLVFHVNAITPELADEISPRLADRLFRNEFGEFKPAVEMGKVAFTGSIRIEMQNITFHALPDPPKKDKGQKIPGCAISNLRAARDISGGFRLEFDVVMPMDVITMRLVEDYYKATCYLTMEPIQREIEIEKDEEKQQSLQDAADGAGVSQITISTDGQSVTLTPQEMKKVAKRMKQHLDGKSAGAGAEA